MSEVDFKLDSWKEENELSEEIMQMLDQKGFNSQLTLSLLTPELIKKEFKTVKPAQMLLLLRAVESLQPSSSSSPDSGDQHFPLDVAVGGQTRSTNNSQAADMAPKNFQHKLSTDGHLSAQDVLGLMDINAGGLSASSQMQQMGTSSHEPGTYKAVFDPLSHVPGAQTTKPRGRYRDIRDYVMALTKSPDTDSCGSLQVGIMLSLLSKTRNHRGTKSV